MIHSTGERKPNDPKLSDSGVRRGTCTVGGKAAAEAGAVTHGAVRCSAWLGVAVIGVVGAALMEKQRGSEDGSKKRDGRKELEDRHEAEDEEWLVIVVSDACVAQAGDEKKRGNNGDGDERHAETPDGIRARGGEKKRQRTPKQAKESEVIRLVMPPKCNVSGNAGGNAKQRQAVGHELDVRCSE